MSIGDESDPRAYVQLASILRKAIAAGKYLPGTATPSITTLSQEYGHARQTCSKALGVLVKEGLLIRYPGLGYYVAGKPGDPPPQNPERAAGQPDEP
jgi:DNA-binding GntR family transcriptional regulator